MAGIHITDIEAAINWWRERKPSPDGITLAPELRALAEVYALMVYYREDEADDATFPGKALDAWKAWYATTPDHKLLVYNNNQNQVLLYAGEADPIEDIEVDELPSECEERD